MKAINHRISAASLLLIIGGSWLEILYSFFSGSIPDQIERIGSKRIMSHRGLSHDLGLWMALILSTLLFPFFQPVLISFPDGRLNEIFHFRTWVLFLPGLIHCMFDLLTPKGVPLLGIRISLPVLKHGSWKEYLLSWGLFFVAITINAEKLGKAVLTLFKRMGFL